MDTTTKIEDFNPITHVDQLWAIAHKQIEEGAELGTFYEVHSLGAASRVTKISILPEHIGKFYTCVFEGDAYPANVKSFDDLRNAGLNVWTESHAVNPFVYIVDTDKPLQYEEGAFDVIVRQPSNPGGFICVFEYEGSEVAVPNFALSTFNINFTFADGTLHQSSGSHYAFEKEEDAQRYLEWAKVNTSAPDFGHFDDFIDEMLDREYPIDDGDGEHDPYEVAIIEAVRDVNQELRRADSIGEYVTIEVTAGTNSLRLDSAMPLHNGKSFLVATFMHHYKRLGVSFEMRITNASPELIKQFEDQVDVDLLVLERFAQS